MSRKLNLYDKDVNEDTLEVSGVYKWDYPEYCDAYFSYGEYFSGQELNDNELDKLTDKYPELVNEMAHKISIV